MTILAQSSIRSIQAITNGLSPRACQLAHVVLANDQTEPLELKVHLSLALLRVAPLDPGINRLGECVVQLSTLGKSPAFKGKQKAIEAVWQEIDSMGARLLVGDAAVWFAVCMNIIHDDPTMAETLH